MHFNAGWNIPRVREFRVQLRQPNTTCECRWFCKMELYIVAGNAHNTQGTMVTYRGRLVAVEQGMEGQLLFRGISFGN